jgi:hypothetical protein
MFGPRWKPFEDGKLKKNSVVFTTNNSFMS